MAMFGKSNAATNAYSAPRHSIPAQLLNLLGMNVLGVNYLGQQDRRAALARLQAANQDAAGLLRPVPGQPVQLPITNNDGEDITAAFAPQMGQGPARMRSPQEIAASLAQLKADNPGFNPAPYRELGAFGAPKDPAHVEGPNGIYERSGDGWRLAQPYPEKSNVPFGWEVGPDGALRPKKGGPFDPDYIARAAGVRRDAVVQRPMPSRAKAHPPNAIKWD